MENKNDIAPSMQGKHDIQLESELKQHLLSNGINTTVQVERRRGKIKVKCSDGDMNATRLAVVTLHPEFAISDFSNGWLTLKEIITL